MRLFLHTEEVVMKITCSQTPTHLVFLVFLEIDSKYLIALGFAVLK
jgi:hypothetical protein